MIFWIEAAVMCLLFHGQIAIVLSKKQAAFVNDYPPIVTDKLREQGLIALKHPYRKTDILRKLIALIVYAVVFALILRFVNSIRSFWEEALTAYGLWLVVD